MLEREAPSCVHSQTRSKAKIAQGAGKGGKQIGKENDTPPPPPICPFVVVDIHGEFKVARRPGVTARRIIKAIGLRLKTCRCTFITLFGAFLHDLTFYGGRGT